MRKIDEITLFNTLRATRPHAFGLFPPYPDDAADQLGMHPHRMYFILGKWSRLGWWDYGVSARLGWFTPEAPQQINA